MPRVIQVIESEVKRGAGHQLPDIYDPVNKVWITRKLAVCRLVTQYHTVDGKFLAEFDRTERWEWDIIKQKYIKIGGENNAREET